MDGQSSLVEHGCESRRPVAGELAEGMRSTSARGVRVKDIGNKRVQGHGLHFYRDIGHGFTLDVCFVKASERDRPEIHLPDPIIDLFQSNPLAFEQV